MAKAAVAAGTATGQCLCGKVTFEIDVPARWAWHDHSAASRRAHGAAYATYVGSWKKRFRITAGKTALTRYEDKATKTARSFCAALRHAHRVRARRAGRTWSTSPRAVQRTHRPPAALSHRDRRAAGMGLYRRAAGAAEGLSRVWSGSARKRRSARAAKIPSSSAARRCCLSRVGGDLGSSPQQGPSSCRRLALRPSPLRRHEVDVARATHFFRSASHSGSRRARRGNSRP